MLLKVNDFDHPSELAANRCAEANGSEYEPIPTRVVKIIDVEHPSEMTKTDVFRQTGMNTNPLGKPTTLCRSR